MDYQPMSMARLASFIAGEPDFDMRWRLVVEFLKEYHHEPAGERQRLLTDAPEPVGDLRWDVLFAGLAEHLAMRDGQDAPLWSASRGLRRFWFPFDTPGARAGPGSCSGRSPATWRVRRRLRDRRGVSDPSPLLDRAGIEDAFRRLGERLARRGVVADLYVFGGAAMALAFDSRRATRDVDALFEPHGIVHEEALAVAAELSVPRWWLNEQASSYVAPGGDPAASRVFDHPGLRVFAASPEHLLAMKAFAARPGSNSRRKTGVSPVRRCPASACSWSGRYQRPSDRSP